MMTFTVINSIIAMIMAEHTRMEELQLIQSAVSIGKKGRTKTTATDTTGWYKGILCFIL